MSRLPRILIIDDQYGRTYHPGEGMHPRTSFCLLGGLKDVTGDLQFGEIVKSPIAEAVFCQAQVTENGVVRNDLETAIAAIREGWKEWPRWAMVMIDLKYITGKVRSDGTAEGQESDSDPSRYFGLSVLERMRSDFELREIPVVLLSSMDRTPIEKRFADHAICDFLDKEEIDRHQGRQRIAGLLENHGLIEDPSGKIIGHSVPLLKCLREARLRARSGGKNILITGERGTGKELLAKYIHEHAGRNDKYIECFLQGIAENLVEDKLFGHYKGAFTGADKDAQGAAELANGGTLFIDEFGSVSMYIQSRLMRLLGEMKVQRMGHMEGHTEPTTVDLLVVLATNRMNLRTCGDFFPDLLDRIDTENNLELPPLRDRREDIPELVSHLVRVYEKKYKPTINAWQGRAIDTDVIDMLSEFPWPGNVRALSKSIDLAINLYPTIRRLSCSHLRLPKEGQEKYQALVPPAGSHCRKGHLTFSHLLDQLESLEFETAPEKRGELADALPRLKAAYSQCSAKLLRTALISTSKPTSEHPEGEIEITNAIGLLRKDLYSLEPNRRTTAAADEIKRQFRQSPQSIQKHWLSDSVLNQAINKAVECRPRNKSSKLQKP